jgi:hypothetical protein
MIVPHRSLSARVARLAAAHSAGLACALLALACGSGERVIISEFVAANGKGLTDKDGDTSDWVELFNTTETPVNLAGWCLTDDPRQLQRWCLPEVVLPAQGYLVVFASGKRQTGQGPLELHAGFKLKASADYLGLVRPRGSIASEFAYPDQRQDVAFGLSSTGAQGFLARPTPGAANSELATGKK